MSNGPFWESKARDGATLERISDFELNRLRSEKCLVPGTELHLGREESKVPVLLLHKPGLSGSGFGAGWDVVVPAGWGRCSLLKAAQHSTVTYNIFAGMPFWMNFVFRGARVGGLREESHLSSIETLSCNASSPDVGWPDSRSGEKEHSTRKEELENNYFKYARHFRRPIKPELRSRYIYQ